MIEPTDGFGTGIQMFLHGASPAVEMPGKRLAAIVEKACEARICVARIIRKTNAPTAC